MKGIIKTQFGPLLWQATDNGVISFRESEKCAWQGQPFRFIANLQTDGTCRIVRMQCKLSTTTLEEAIITSLQPLWNHYLETHPSVKLRLKGQVKQKVLKTNLTDLWKILEKMEAQIIAFRLTLEELDKQ